jgi:hypothetical protein
MIGDVYEDSSPASPLAEADFKRYIMLCACETFNINAENPVEAWISWMAVFIRLKGTPFERLLDLQDVEDPAQFFTYYLNSVLASVQTIKLATHNKRLFRLDSAVIGLAPKSFQVGDLVLVVPGSRVPLLIREMSRPDSFELVGSVYAHGMMHGDLATSSIVEENGFAEFILI